LSTTHSAASRIRRSASLSGCPIGVEARIFMKPDCLSFPEADGSLSAPMARRTSATDGWVGAGVGVFLGGDPLTRRRIRRTGSPEAEDATTARRGAQAAARCHAIAMECVTVDRVGLVCGEQLQIKLACPQPRFQKFKQNE
jgi:hypothetical protein